MIRVKDTYINTNDIKSIEFSYRDHFYLVISYMFCDKETCIEVRDLEEYNEVADDICNKINSFKK